MMIAFLTEGNDLIGMGHYLRCSGIAEGLIETGEDVCYIIPSDSDRAFPESKHFDTYMVQSPGESGWDLDEACNLLNKLQVKTVIADSYRLNDDDFKHIRVLCRIVYLDDLDKYGCNVDAVINFNPGADAEKYLRAGIPKRAVYTGVEFYPLRKEFEGKRIQDIRKDVENVLLTSGSTDPYECMLNILNGIEPDSFSNIKFGILLGKYYSDEYINKLEVFCKSHRNVVLLPWGDRVSEFLIKSDLLITPGSSMVMEGLSVNVPCITYEFTDNQHETVRWLDELGMAASFGRLPAFESGSEMKSRFISELDYDVRIRRSLSYSESFDGKGLQRVIDIICKREY